MSQMLYINERVYSLEEWASLDEAVSPKETPFGTDSKNGQWHRNGDWAHTFFSHENSHMMVALHTKNGIVGFGSHKGEFSNNPLDYTEERTGINSAMTTFSKAMYVTLKGAHEHNMNSIRLSGADDRLDRAYQTMVNSHHIQKHMKEAGYNYSGKHAKYHVFERT